MPNPGLLSSEAPDFFEWCEDKWQGSLMVSILHAAENCHCRPSPNYSAVSPQGTRVDRRGPITQFASTVNLPRTNYTEPKTGETGLAFDQMVPSNSAH